MKPVSPIANARRFEPAQNLAWLLQLDGPGLALRVANRSIEFDGETWEGALLETPAYAMQSRGDFGPGGLIVTRAALRIADPLPSSGLSPLASLVRASASEFAAILRLVWLDENDAADPDDALAMLTGGLASIDREVGSVVLHLADPISLLDDQSVVREFDWIEDAPANTPLRGRALPVVFGVHDRLRLTPFESGPETELAAPLAIDDDQAFVVSLENFPSSGIAQVGDELIRFDAVDPVGPALGTPALPLVRLETPVPHSAGQTVRAEPPNGFTWFVADHPCESVSGPRVSGEPLAPGTWTPLVASLGGRDVQLLRLDRVPSGSLTARVEGWPLSGGGVAAHPVDVLEILLTDSRFAGLDASALDLASFDQVRDELSAVGAAFARVLDSTGLRLGDLIDGASREMAAWLRSTGDAITLTRAEPIPPIETVASLGDDTALDPQATAGVRPEPAPFPSGLVLDRNVPVADPGDPSAATPFFLPFEPAPGAVNETHPPLTRHLAWLDGRSAPALEDLARRIAPTLGDARTRARHRFLPAHAALEPGDAVDLTRPPLGLAADGLFVERIETGGPAVVVLQLEGPLSGPACFSVSRPAPGGLPPAVSFVRPFGGGRRLLIALNGTYVARVAWNGRLNLAGALAEIDALTFTPPWNPDDGPIALHDPDGVPGPGPGSDDRLVLAYGESAASTPFLSLNDTGGALTDATLVENVPLPPPPAADCVESAADGFTLAPHPSAAALHYDAATNELRLAGELVEGAALNGS